MAITSPSTPRFSPTFCCKRTDFSPSLRCFSSVSLTHRTCPPTRRLLICSRVNSKPSDAGGFISPENGDEFSQYDMPRQFGAVERRSNGSSVFVTLPMDVVELGGRVRRKKVMEHSLKTLALAGVEGVVIEVWWSLVEGKQPGVYNWRGYFELVEMADKYDLKVRVVIAFHQRGDEPTDPHWIPLPQWVLEEINKDPDLAFTDRFGRKNKEYISLGCDTLPVLKGRSPVQAYADLIRNFRDTFRPLLSDIITGIQIGLGPAGELRYPSCPSNKQKWPWRSHELGEFQCYDKYMLASLKACVHEVGMHEWGNAGPSNAINLMQDLENTEFFRSDDGYWNTPYEKFFLEWYSGMLLHHGQRICMHAANIFRGIEMNMSAKVSGIQSHPSELTAGYYNTSTRDGYLPITEIFRRYQFSLCCTGFDMQDGDENQVNPVSSPEGLLRQIVWNARINHIPLEGENSAPSWDDKSFQQVLKMRKFYSYGLKKPLFSFNFVRMDKNMFEVKNWARFSNFVRQMSDPNLFQAKLDFGDDIQLSLMSDDAKSGAAFACC